jgi:hypothetical protein
LNSGGAEDAQKINQEGSAEPLKKTQVLKSGGLAPMCFCLRLATRNFLLAFERHLGEKKHVGVVPGWM